MTQPAAKPGPIARTIWWHRLGWPFGAKKVKKESKSTELRKLPAAPY